MLEDQLLFRSIKGFTSQEEEQTVAAWRAAAPANERRYRELKLVLEAAGRSHRLVETKAPPVLDLLEEAARREQRRDRPWRRAAPAVRRTLAAAAVAAIAAGATWFARPSRAPAGLGVTELMTGPSEVATVGLSDGTVVRLAPSSQIRFNQTATGREVALTGRGFFVVAKQHGLPFRVRTTAGDLTVLGTRFDVEARDSALRTVVVEGRVAVTAPDGIETRVGAGQVSRVVEGHLRPTVRIPDLGSETKWVGRFLAFQNTPLRDVAREIERTYPVRVVLDRAIADRTVTTWLADRDIAEVVRIVCAVSLAHCTTERGVVTIAGS
ncbi:MAG: FecR domain-containing protein [Gemmatimonadota bacterium]